MKILTASEMKAVDRATIDAGIPGIILMESAASSVVDVLREEFAPLSDQRIVVFCGKGNNGGDGFAIARQLFTKGLCSELIVVEAFDRDSLAGDAAENRHMLEACGCPIHQSLPEDASATVIVDALLGTGLNGSARGAALDCIRLINRRFPHAHVVAVDIPSGLPSDHVNIEGEYVHADITVTFTAPKISQCFAPTYELMGDLIVSAIGTPDQLCQTNSDFKLHLSQPDEIAHLVAPRVQDSNKGLYGHVLVVGGSRGKPGAPAMSSLAALRCGAGLVTTGTSAAGANSLLSIAPELMTEALAEADNGHLSLDAFDQVESLMQKMTLLAIGPGLGTDETTKQLVRKLYEQITRPMVVDADALNALAGNLPKTKHVRVLTPHPGEMARLIGKTTKEVQADRLLVAEQLANESGATIVLKGDRTVIAFPDGTTWINPTGSPSMATGGTGDILTGMIAGFMAQFPDDWMTAVTAGVWLHGRCGEIGADKLGEQSMLATDLLHYLPEAMDELRSLL